MVREESGTVMATAMAWAGMAWDSDGVGWAGTATTWAGLRRRWRGVGWEMREMRA